MTPRKSPLHSVVALLLLAAPIGCSSEVESSGGSTAAVSSTVQDLTACYNDAGRSAILAALRAHMVAEIDLRQLPHYAYVVTYLSVDTDRDGTSWAIVEYRAKQYGGWEKWHEARSWEVGQELGVQVMLTKDRGSSAWKVYEDGIRAFQPGPESPPGYSTYVYNHPEATALPPESIFAQPNYGEWDVNKRTACKR